MTDIVERLRDWPNMTPIACKEAADEIERLRAENRKLCDMVKLMMDYEPATIERCAQIVDNYKWPDRPMYPSQPIRETQTIIAAAIRTLKDKP